MDKQKQMMNGPITVRGDCEIIKAIGPDGLSASYYKCFEDELFQKMMNSILDSGRITEIWTCTKIFIIIYT